MTTVRISPPMVSRTLPFHMISQMKSTQKKLYGFGVQKKSRRMPRLVLSNLSSDDDQDDRLESKNGAPQLNDSSQKCFEGSQFEDIAPVAEVECTSLGCRPVFPDDLSYATLPDGWLPYEHAMRVLNARIKNYKNMEVDPHRHFQKDFARYLNKVWMQKDLAEKYYEQAIAMEPRNPQLLAEYAEFFWMSLGNVEKAEELFNAALQEDPNNSTIHGSYAFFMWTKER